MEDRVLLAGDSLATAWAINLNGEVSEAIGTPGEVDFFKLTLNESGRLTVRTRTALPAILDTRTGLLGPEGQPLVQSEGRSAANPDDLIVQHLLAGTYYLNVEGLNGRTDWYTLATEFQPATPPQEPLLVNFIRDYPFALQPSHHAAGDFNGDGHLDLATANIYTNDVSVLLGLGDGSFQPPRNFTVGLGPFAIVAADFNGDGSLDLATANQLSNDVSILLNRGDGTFADELRSAGGTFAWGLSAGDFNGDGRLDLATANLRTNDVSVLLGQGDGTFQAERRFAAGDDPDGVSVADLNRDGRPDLVTSNFNSNDISVLLGRGDGTFQDQLRFSVGEAPTKGAAGGDFNGDGQLDIATANSGSSDISVLFGRGDGTFAGERRYAAGASVFAVVTSDFDGDGRLDLAAANRQSNDVSIFLGHGDGTFQEPMRFRVGQQPLHVLAGDFNGDGRPDLSTANARSHDVSLLLGVGDGMFQQDPAGFRQGETNPQGMVARDFNRDGHLDLVTISYTGGEAFVFLGRGDGGFHHRVRYAVGSTPVEVVAEDFNGDGLLDLATANCDSSDTSVLLGRGDGTFQEQQRYQASSSGEFIVAADFNNDRHLDLITGGQFAFGVAVILGRGDGTFQDETIFAVEEAPADGVAGDFNGDGHLDLATTNVFSPNHDISLHLGRGDGTFENPVHFPVGESPLGLAAGDFNGDGHLDLANANFGAQSVSLLLGRGDGTFQDELRLAVGPLPDFLLSRDINGDGRLDLVVSNSGSSDVSVLLGRGNGTFELERRFTTSDGPTPRRGLEAADFNADGQLDLALPQVLSNDVAILLGSGDGQFSSPRRFAVGLGPAALVTGDFTGDGRLDVASVNPTTNEVAISLGTGDATLQGPRHFTVGTAPAAAATGDFNGDGRLDLATANFGSSDVSVLLGLGTGTFVEEHRVPAGTNPTAMVAGDFDGDNRLDLAVANAGSHDVSLLLGRGDGAFTESPRLSALGLPQALAAGDFNGDGRLDLATANYQSGDVAVFLGRGNGTFQPALRFTVGAGPVALAAGDLDGDGRLDLAVASLGSDNVSVLLGRGDGTFRSAVHYAAGTGPASLTLSDFDGDGRLDLGVANSISDDLTLLLGSGDGTFAGVLRRPLGDFPVALVAADFNGDARADLAIATQMAADVSLLQGLGDATFVEGGVISNPIRSTPLVLDFNGDGTPDVAVLDRAGKILLRLGRPGAAGVFEPPTILNPDPRYAARDLAIVATPRGPVLAALDAKNSALSLYTLLPNGAPARTDGPHIPGALPAVLRAGDLSGDGHDDLVVAAAGSDQVFVYLQSVGPAGAQVSAFPHLVPDYALAVGASPSAIELADVDHDRRLDILVMNQLSGDVSVLANDATQPFAGEMRFRAAAGLYSLLDPGDGLTVRSPLRPTDFVAGHFDAGQVIDVVVAGGGLNRLSILRGSPAGGFLNPAAAPGPATGLRPAAVVAGRFNNDSHLDVAVLNEGGGNLSIFLGDGRGGFTEQLSRDASGRDARPSAGNLPTGLSVHDVNGDGRQDLLVGNEFGDLLKLLGNGDGTFQPYERTGANITLAVADLNGDGADDFVFANQARDRLSVQYSLPGQTFAQDRGDGLLAPGAVSGADLNRDGRMDLVIANGGANNVLVYLGVGQGQFDSGRGFFAGANPSGISIEDLNGDGFADLVVANEGSNDVTVLLGQGELGQWTLTNGPRLRAGAGPTSTAVRDLTGDQIPDLLVSNSQSNNVFLLPGVGRGFFDDRNPLIRPVGSDPGQVLSVGSSVITVNRGSNNLTLIPNFFLPGRSDFSSGGLRPVAAVVGDFGGDGRSDLMVANNGNGVVSLLVGDASGFILSRTFSHANAPHPSALAISTPGGVVEIYVTDEGHESAILLTSFGIPVPAPGGDDPQPPPPDIVLVSGPGFLIPVDLFSSGEADGFVPQIQAIPLEQFAALAFASLVFDGGELFDDSPQAEDAADADPEAASSTIAFMIGVDDALRDTLAEQSKASLDAVLAAIDQVFEGWLPALFPEVQGADVGRWLALAGVPGMGNGLLTSFLLLRETLPRIVDYLYELGEELLPDRDTRAAAPAGEQHKPSMDVVLAAVDQVFNGWLPSLLGEVKSADTGICVALLSAAHQYQALRLRMEEKRTRRAPFLRAVRRCS